MRVTAEPWSPGQARPVDGLRRVAATTVTAGRSRRRRQWSGLTAWLTVAVVREGRAWRGVRTPWLVAGLTLAAAACGGAGSSGSGRPAATAPAAFEWSGPQPVDQPDLSRLAPPVQAQVRERYDAVSRAAGDPGASSPVLGDAYGELGLILMAAGYRDRAEIALLNAHGLAPRAMRWPYYLAHLYRQEGDRDRAAGFFARGLALEPAHLAGLVWLGRMELDRGRPARAAAAFERALAVDPASAAALAGAGRAALAARDAGRAVGYLERALALEPAAGSLHYALGMAHRALGNLDAAQSHLERRGDGAPAPPDPLMRDYNGLLRSALAYAIRGMRAMDGRRFDEAAAIFREGLVETPDDPSLRHRLGTALMMAGDAEGAVREFEATLRIAPDFEKAQFGLGVILGMSGRHAEAAERYAAAVELRPNYLEARLGLAEALRLGGRLQEAAAQFAEAIRIDPAFAEAWMVRAVILLQLGRSGEAREWLREALLVHPGHPDLTALLAQVEEG